MKRFGKNLDASQHENILFMRIWRRYGVIGFGLLAPMTVGAQLGAIIGVTLNISCRQLILWMSLGVSIWSVALTLLAVAGVNLVEAL